jgi:hypothetical protein
VLASYWRVEIREHMVKMIRDNVVGLHLDGLFDELDTIKSRQHLNRHPGNGGKAPRLAVES